MHSPAYGKRKTAGSFPSRLVYFPFLKTILLSTAAIFLTLAAFCQPITISAKNESLEKVLRQVEEQSDYTFVFSHDDLQNAKPVSLQIKNASIEHFLSACFAGQPFLYKLSDHTIVIELKTGKTREETPAAKPLSGLVTSVTGEPVIRATIALAKSNFSTFTNESGQFSFADVGSATSVVISCVGFETREVDIEPGLFMRIVLQPSISQLDATVVMAYGTTTRRLNTGNISKLSSEEIARQPISNVMMALDGRIPGLTAVQGSGLPGAVVKIQVRGQSSLIQGSEPLFIIDGVPFAPGNSSIEQLNNALSLTGGGLSGFNSVNPSDIESIEVLKDADATAIYGSRGANGVILITTKKSHSSKTSFNFSLSSAISRASSVPEFLSTEQYIAMRREAFANDGITPTVANAPDLLLWDTTRYTNFPKMIMGGTAHVNRASASVMGGNSFTNFLASASWSKESYVFPGVNANSKGNIHLNLSHASSSRNFRLDLSTLYGYDDIRSPAQNMAGYINLPPNAPPLYTSDGHLNWQENGASFQNPMSQTLRRYRSQIANLVSNVRTSLRITDGLEWQMAIGYNRLTLDETSQQPIASQDPDSDPRGTSRFANSSHQSWSFEPQLHYRSLVGPGTITALLGATYQHNGFNGFNVTGTEYTNDALLQSLTAAPAVTTYNNSFTQYRYAAAFARINYNLYNKYILNLSGRRDGSSRFGPGRQWATFGAIGAAWIFSEEKFLDKLSFLSHGKLRGSFGTTGNDQIGDYKYYDTWGAISPYQSTTALIAQSLFNPDYGWELTRKWEAALELGFFNNRLLVNGAWFKHRSSNQLVNYVLPAQTGFLSILSNFPATIQNSGWEFELSSDNIKNQDFQWSTHFNITLPANRLVAFPDLESSSYFSSYIIGKPINLIYRYKSEGVDPATGIYSFRDVDNNGVLSAPADKVYSGDLDPAFYGGMGNNFSFKSFSLNIFLSFKKQLGTNYLHSLYGSQWLPGLMYNQPQWVLDRWQKPGDITDVQRFTAMPAGPVYAVRTRFTSSDAPYSDASFIRLKNIELAWSAPPNLLKKIHLQGCRFQLQAQNLFTFTRYRGLDPETQNLFSMPPLKTLAAGIQITL
jgi:TonB-linked SusC/RagA family outer membrane protein